MDIGEEAKRTHHGIKNIRFINPKSFAPRIRSEKRYDEMGITIARIKSF